MSKLAKFRAYLTQRGKGSDWSERQLLAALRLVEAQLSITDADNTPGRMMIDEEKFLRVWHDEDVDHNQYIQFGIAVGPPQHRESRPAARTLLREALSLQSLKPMSPMEALNYFRS